MEIFRVNGGEHKKIVEVFVPESRLFSPQWKPGRMVTNASRVYKYLEETGAAPELMNDFAMVCDLAEIPYVYIVSEQEDR